MAKVDGADLAIIDRLGPEVDFYYWKGILCVRMMPRKGRQPGTPAQRETWAALQYANDEYNLLLQNERDAYKDLAAPSQMSGRDLFIKMILRNYAQFGPNYNRVTIRIQGMGSWGFGVYLTKVLDSTVDVLAMTPEEFPLVLQWREISPTLRGKRLLRRWDLSIHPENASFRHSLNVDNYRWSKGFLNSGRQFYIFVMYAGGAGSKFGHSGLYRYDPPQ